MNIFDANSLNGKTYLVTGASSGIGKAAAKALSGCGAKVIIAGRDEGRLDESLMSLLGGGHTKAVCAFEDADQVCDWIKSLVESNGALDGVFHCAGTELIRPIRMTKQAQLSNIFGSSLFAAFGLARGLSQKNAMNDGGSIVFMSSVAGSVGQVGMTAYSAAKAAIDGMVRSLACELAPRKIRVNSVVAGAIKTAMHERLTHGNTEEVTLKYEQMHLLGFGEADDIAQCAIFLLGPGSRWITGTSLVVDGGYLAR
jgi:NAD(P)-dependent dehydrogenase (short-subunit alcohol dehydrogenase family)